MTSPSNDNETKQHFEEHHHFGLNPQQVHIFCQGTIPVVDFNGHFIPHPTIPSAYIETPDGNGGVYASLLENGCIEQMEKEKIEYVHFIGIDNVMAKPADPSFIGLCATQKVQLGNKAITKVLRGEVVD